MTRSIPHRYTQNTQMIKPLILESVESLMRGWKRLQLEAEYNMTDRHALAGGFSNVEFQLGIWSRQSSISAHSFGSDASAHIL